MKSYKTFLYFITLLFVISGLLFGKGIFYRLSYSDREILDRQLLGDGCGYRIDCRFSLLGFAGWNIRHPSHYCPMMAAECLVTPPILLRRENGEMPLPSNVTQLSPTRSEINIFDQALRNQQASFDTGDGIINYGQCLNSAKAKADKLFEFDVDFSLLECN